MNERMLELVMRHGMLKAEIDEQRRLLAAHAKPIEALLVQGDRLHDGIDWLKSHPGTVGAAFAAFVIVRPKRAWRWARRGLIAWRGWTALRNSLLGAR